MKKVLSVTLLAALMAALMAAPVMAAGDPDAGKVKAAVCAACHGIDGVALIPTYPNLKGQNQPYLVSALKAYKNKERTGVNAMIMQPQAAMLTDQDIEDLAAYFSSLK